VASHSSSSLRLGDMVRVVSFQPSAISHQLSAREGRWQRRTAPLYKGEMYDVRGGLGCDVGH